MMFENITYNDSNHDLFVKDYTPYIPDHTFILHYDDHRMEFIELFLFIAGLCFWTGIFLCAVNTDD